MAVALKGIQTGSATIGTADSQVTATITAVTKSKSFLLFSVRGDSASPAEGLVAGQITDSTTLTFKRYASSAADDIVIEWQVVEFDSGVLVYHGDIAGTASTSMTDSIGGNVDNDLSFVLAACYNDGTTYSGDDYVTVELSNSGGAPAGFSDQLTFTCQQNIPAANVHWWQVVQYDDCAVQTGTAAVSTSAITVTDTITAVDLSKSIILMSDLGQNATGNMGTRTWNAAFDSTTQISFTRESVDTFARTIAWQVIEFTGAEEVQRANVNFNSSTTTQSPTLASAVSQSGSVILLLGRYGYEGRTPHSAADDMAPYAFTATIDSSTGVTLTRAASRSSSAVANYAVIQFTSNVATSLGGQEGTTHLGTIASIGNVALTPTGFGTTSALGSLSSGIPTLGEITSDTVVAYVGSLAVTLAGASISLGMSGMTAVQGTANVVVPIYGLPTQSALAPALGTLVVALDTAVILPITSDGMTASIGKPYVWERIDHASSTIWETIYT